MAHDFENKQIFQSCIKQLTDSAISLIKNSGAYSNISNQTDELVGIMPETKVELEITLFVCADLFTITPVGASEDQISEFKVRILEYLNRRFREEILILPSSYFEMRLDAYKKDLQMSYQSSDYLPLYSFYSIFKSPLIQFDLSAISDYDVLEVMKFKFIQKSIHGMSAKLIEVIYTYV